MKYRVKKIQHLKILIQNISVLVIWNLMGVDASAIQNILPMQENIEPERLTPPVIDSHTPRSSFTPILISSPDDFKPGLNPTLTELNSQSSGTISPSEQLGWPQPSDAEKLRKVEQERKNKAKEDEIQRKILEVEQKIKKKLEQAQKKTSEQEQKLQRKQAQKAKEALFQAQEREERQEQIRAKALEKEKVQQAKLEREKQKKIEIEAKRKVKEESKQQKNIAKSQKVKSKSKDKTPLITLKSLTNDSSSSVSSLGQGSQASNGTAIFELFNKDLLTVSSGFNTYTQSTVKPIQNIPLKIGWQRDINKNTTVSVSTGIDWFNRVPIAYSFKANAKTELKIPSKLGKGLLISAELDYGPYKFNAETIQNQIQYLRARGSLFWQIDSKTSLSSINYIGILNDGNQEFQSFDRIERKIGKFSVAGNLFSWNFSKDLSKQSGYFSPPDFLVYNVEVAWEDKITKFLSCRLSATLGQQRANRKFSNANTLQALCSAKITKNIDIDFGYAFSNIFTGGNVGSGSANTNTILGGINVKF
jgi:Cellulose synthase operon protein C C-terminus (BCSC_C)